MLGKGSTRVVVAFRSHHFPFKVLFLFRRWRGFVNGSCKSLELGNLRETTRRNERVRRRILLQPTQFVETIKKLLLVRGKTHQLGKGIALVVVQPARLRGLSQSFECSAQRIHIALPPVNSDQ